jgi:hypothetical protein
MAPAACELKTQNRAAIEGSLNVTGIGSGTFSTLCAGCANYHRRILLKQKKRKQFSDIWSENQNANPEE